MRIDNMPLDKTLFENTQHGQLDFPIQYYVDELHKFFNRRVPLHWHFEPEFFVARGGSVLVHVGQHCVELKANDGIFISSNTLHCYEQKNENDVCECPNIVFSAELIAPYNSVLYKKYVMPILADKNLPYVILHAQESWHSEILIKLENIFALLQRFGSESSYGSFPFLDFNMDSISEVGFEMQVQFLLSQIWLSFVQHQKQLPTVPFGKRDLQYQARLQNMISFIKENYMNPLTLEDISNSANISKSEASRCFNSYVKCSPVEYLLQYRIEVAQCLLHGTIRSIQEISLECGFSSPSYFIRMFRKKVGVTPGEYRKKNSI
ncbi:AraC family transcriptional regulator [Niallia circulans]|uniref:AraC family transcriptional regulator n=1 Tax=Niallia circulans TaxID=1397 RepID=UPI0015608643|nr:helix-turn-helix domain-containing protein [Niallia circulans]NRG31500.1 helix-turn-helix domain-containing protein [Niallia circulans]